MGIDIWLDVDEAYTDFVDQSAVTAAVAATLARLDVEDAELAIAITSDEEVLAYNLEYRGIDAPTDVLSFAAQDSRELDSPAELATPELPAQLAAEIERYLGDIIIAFPYASRQAAHFGNSASHEILLLAVHGTLHLLGYDHDSPEDESEMWALQEEILSEWGVKGLSQREYDE